MVSPPLTHILPPGMSGAQNVPPNYDPYPYNPTKAKQMLASAGYPNGLTLKMLYRPSSSLSAKIFQTLQADLATIGVKVTGVGVPDADFYTKYLEVPSVAAQRHVGHLARGLGPGLVPRTARCRSSSRCSPARPPTRRSAATSGSTTTQR